MKAFESIFRFQKEQRDSLEKRKKNSNSFLSRTSCFHFAISIISTDHENSIKHDSRDDGGVDVDNEDDLPMELDSGDHDSNDMSRPRKIRR